MGLCKRILLSYIFIFYDTVMPGDGPKFYNCVVCNKRTKPKDRRKLNKPIIKFVRKNFLIEPKENDHICSTCVSRHYSGSPISKLNRNSETPQNETDQPVTSNSVPLPIPATSNSHAYCFVCKRPGPKLVVVGSESRFSAFLHNNIVIPPGSRCCPVHLDAKGLIPSDVLASIKTSDEAMVDSHTVYGLLQKLREETKKHLVTRLDFDTDGVLTETDYLTLTGLSKANFDDLCDHVTPHIRHTPVRSTRASLGIFLMKMKSGLSNKLISTLCNVSKSSVHRAVASVRRCLMASFVPQYLGLQHITREAIISDHTRPLAQKLFCNDSTNQVVLVLDGLRIRLS